MQIEVGKRYIVSYHDPNYPCHCPCHTGHAMHIMACCYDRSYLGPATCVEAKVELPKDYYAFSVLGYMDVLLLHESSVLREATDED
jgi:putative lipase involved disintegration of autophagic bodies